MVFIFLSYFFYSFCIFLAPLSFTGFARHLLLCFSHFPPCLSGPDLLGYYLVLFFRKKVEDIFRNVSFI